jgi:predicted DNA-binding transcriptional regulator AlpA
MADLTNHKCALPAGGIETFAGDGLMRLRDIITPGGPLPMSRSSFLQGVAEGRIPRPVKLGPRISAWRRADLREFLSRCHAAEGVAGGRSDDA